MASYFLSRTIFAFLLILSLSSWAANPTIESIDKEVGHAVSTSYNQFLKSTTVSNSLRSVYERANAYYQAKNYADSLRTLAEERALEEIRLGDTDLQAIVRLALQLYAYSPVEKLLQTAQEQGDALSEAKLSFELARFYSTNEHWNKVSHLLANSFIFEQLTKKDMAEAYVLLGTALQKQKKHREALGVYEKITKDSEHYRIAQLNLASALLRQEWWTDAHIAINTALQQNTGKRDELDFRLYTMMGFSQIQFGFYRDARESFRNVAISSQYAQRALLGLGIAALHQQDFIGALNAFDKLRSQPQKDISIAEAHLLSAFALRQLEQFDAATSRYQEAIDYYQTLSTEIQSFLNPTDEVSIHFLRPEHQNDSLLRNNSLKTALLDSLTSSNASNSQAFSNLMNRIRTESARRANVLLQEEKKAIDSYLSQSRFGLASLYDNK